MQHMTSGMVKSVDLLQQQTVLIMENQPRRDYEGHGLHRLTDPPFLHATHHYHLSAFTYTIFPEHFHSQGETIGPLYVCPCVSPSFPQHRPWLIPDSRTPVCEE